MISYFLSFFSNWFSKNVDDDDDDKENFLAEELLDLEVTEPTSYELEPVQPEIPRGSVCFKKTGIVTVIEEDRYILIDGILYYDLSTCCINLKVKDKVLYLAYKDSNDSIIVVRILENQGICWEDEKEFEKEGDSFQVIEHTLVGEVDDREDRFVIIKGNEYDRLKFNLDNVEGTIVPVKGDWLELKCKVQYDENHPTDISAAQVLQVTSFKPLRTKIKTATISNWFGEYGSCDRQIYFDKQSLQNGVTPTVGTKVIVEAIESIQGTCTWRAIKVVILDNGAPVNENTTVGDDYEETSSVESEKNLEVTKSIKFDNVSIQQTAVLQINITNKSNDTHILNKWIMLSRKRDSQVDIEPFLSRPRKIFPQDTFSLNVTCKPKFLGSTTECLVLSFKGFQIKRFIDMNIVDKTNSNGIRNDILYKSESEKIGIMRKIRNNGTMTIIPGVRPVKPPAFIPVKLGMFPIPDKVWSAVLGDSEQTIYGSDFHNILDRIETYLPCLIQDLNINNYIDKWHTLLYMEEIQANISMRAYDTPKAFLIRCQEYLCLEIKGLAERRPSLIKGDRVIVKDIWSDSAPQYEGFIHAIKNDMVLIQFNRHFHETYSGSDVSIEFHFTRTMYRRAHQAVNLAISNLGPDILFPRRLTSRSHQVPSEHMQNIKWFNNSINSGQKSAITNILIGECRPLPYCIFGPPGTGKTITVVETILQILTLMPDSRILVATPSNSAANLLMERLIKYRDVVPNSIIRLIASYLVDSDNIPDIIKPFCATMDIAAKDSSKPKHVVKDGINLNCQSSYIGRHRVTIGTCNCLGALAQMGLPKGHFSHIIIDEAGQATEPEIMIPLTFLDKDNGQVILAGDPMQLGPVIMSKYCQNYGMDESYLSRLLDTYPYQKDYAAYADGYDYRLVTKLNDNYRSLETVLSLPSELFYDSTLVAKIDQNQPWLKKLQNDISEILDLPNANTGGIYVHGIRGENYRAEDSPSWYNPHEASMVALTTCKLFKNKINADDIGIITPYIAQIRHLRLLFEAMGLPQPKIGTVEEFQGQERPIILISTVRASASHLAEDHKHVLGFVKNPKRLNVALTRAQVAVLLFCDPHLLSRDQLWRNVIQRAVKEDKYVGCNLPSAVFDDQERF
ncbi:probable RNA helicase armi [Amyelois transitella]|uniref:probable RNA helicase armi n=1 Tax=Amyelois transitella TaxID=680683 RepID=UPI00298F8C25|nr:probable RNA helicase armi [Amyelois transitella]XP_060806307.1 probable RNA helicase armi [Amyelois transitella]XP_060806311.1 probable RNA helicase armi [Amyelois transitella]